MSTDPQHMQTATEDYRRIEQAIRYLEAHSRQRPTLAEVASSTGLSEYHFHRLFSRWVGISPQRFLQALTAEYAKDCLRSSRSTMEAAWAAGLSGSSRLHDLMINVEAMSPGEVKREGAGLVIRTGVHPSPFGKCWLAITDRGLCGLEFLDERTSVQARDELAARWPGATVLDRPFETQKVLLQIFPAPGLPAAPAGPLTLNVKGTNFQIKVWQALLQIPPGCMVSYGDLARGIGQPGASRAVGSAVGKNPVAFVVPCHRVIRSVAKFGNYRWGSARKKALLGWEAALSTPA